MSLPPQWVDRIFEKLTLVYGRDFLRRWDGIPIDDVKADWARELAGFAQLPESIAHALKNLPRDDPPNVYQFRDLCRRAPPKQMLRIEAPRPDRARVKAHIDQLVAQMAAKWTSSRVATDTKNAAAEEVSARPQEL